MMSCVTTDPFFSLTPSGVSGFLWLPGTTDFQVVFYDYQIVGCVKSLTTHGFLFPLVPPAVAHMAATARQPRAYLRLYVFAHHVNQTQH